MALIEFPLTTKHMRKRFNPSSIASSDGTHVHLLHDRKAGTTGRRVKQIFAKCGQRLIAVTPRQAMMLAPLQRVARL